MRILNIVGTLDKSAGGPSRSVPQTCENVSALGVDIELVTRPSENPVKVNTTATYKVTFRTITELILFGLKLSKKEVSLIHLQHVWTPYIHIMARIARLKGIPYIITPRGMLEPWALNEAKWKKIIAMLIYQKNDLANAACIHSTAQMEANNIRNLGLTKPISVIPNGVDLKDFPLYVEKQKKGKKTLLFLSRIHPKKGIELLIEAWKQLDKTLRRNWQIEITGNGEESYISSLRNLILKYGLDEDIIITGPQFGKDKISAYNRADIFVLPTYSENFGIVVAEALACKVPVITTKGAPWEDLQKNGAGWWIDIGIEPLTIALKEALNLEENTLKRMGLNGRKLIEDKYSIESVAKQMIQLYDWVLGKIDKPSFIRLD